MEPTDFILIAFCITTSLISGVFGMLGGLILMGALTWLLPIEEAFLLHGVLQLLSNLQRYLQLRAYARLRAALIYLLGAGLAFVALRGLEYRPDPVVTYALLGTLAFLPSLKRLPKPSFSHPLAAFVAGILVNGMQLLAGVAGPLLELFFRDGRMSRLEAVSTKALTQTLSHLFKIVFYAELALRADLRVLPSVSASTLALALAATMAGTALSKPVLERLSDANFYRLTLHALQALGVFYLVKASYAA